MQRKYLKIYTVQDGNYLLRKSGKGYCHKKRKKMLKHTSMLKWKQNNKYLILLSSLSLLYYVYVLTKFHNVPLITMFFSFLNTSQHLTDLFILSSNIN